MTFTHGVYVSEEDTALTIPVQSSAGLQIVFGTAPVNMAADISTVLEPKLCYDLAEAKSQLGYSTDFANYTLCQSMFASFSMRAVSPVVFVNVLDPEKHTKAVAEQTVSVANKKATVETTGLLPKSLVVKNGTAQLTKDTDYTTAFDSDGYLIITLLGDAAAATSLTVSGSALDPTQVDANDVIGSIDANDKATGIECVRDIYPLFGLNPGILIAPGWSQNTDVSTALIGKCEGINGNKQAICAIDVDSSKTGAVTYTAVKTQKEKQGIANRNAVALWPMVKSGSKLLYFSAVWAALAAYLDGTNEDVPALLPSNKNLGITGAVTASGVDVNLDQERANLLNANGICTALKVAGSWRAWGDRMSVYPGDTDPKENWINIRRMFNWWSNTIIDTYLQNVDDLLNPRLRDEIVASENIRGNYFVFRGWVAVAKCYYLDSDNPTTSLVDGKLTLRLDLSPYPGAETIRFVLQYDADAVSEAFSGGAE